MSQHEQYHDPESEAAKWNSAVIKFIIYTSYWNVSCVKKACRNRIYFVIAGTMLLVTAFFNFILSKKTKIKSPKRPQESLGDQGPTTVCVTEGAAPDTTLSFLHMMTGRRGGPLALTTRDRCLGLGEREESVRAMLELEQEQATALKDTDRERRRWKERRLICFSSREEPVEREMEEMDGYCEPDTTSDTAPMITN